MQTQPIIYIFSPAAYLHVCVVGVRAEIVLPSGVSPETVKARRLPEDGCALTPCASSGRVL